jgi:hypothetical protein
LIGVGINFVGNPIIFQQECEEHSQHPERAAEETPAGLGKSGLHDEFGEVGGGVAEVGEEAQDDEGLEGAESERGAEVGPGQDHPEQDHGGEDGVIEEACGLPEAGGVAEGGGLRGVSGHRLHLIVLFVV